MYRGAKSPFLVYVLVSSLIVASLPYQLWRAYASTITSAKIVFTTIEQSTTADQTIEFITPTGVAAGETITVTYPTGFDVSTFAVNNADLAVSAAGSCASFSDVTLAASPSGATWGVAVSGQAITFTSGTGTVAAGRCVQIEFGSNATTGAAGATFITNQSAAQNNSDPLVNITAGASDSGSIAVEIISGSTVSVSAAVVTSISCALNDTSAAFGTFTINTVTTADSTPVWTISTNATAGYVLSVKSAGNGVAAGLYSSGASYNIASATADLASASSGYGLQATKSDGDAGSATTTVASPFTATGTNVGTLVITAIPGSGTQVASASGPVANATVTSTLKAKVSGLVPAGSYVDTLTYSCSGTF